MLYGFILVMLYGCFLPHLNILKNSKKSILIKKYLHKILVKWLTLVLRTTCRFTFADTNILLQGCIRDFEPDSHAPIGGEIFLLLLHTLMCSLTKFQLYAFFFGRGGVRPLFFSKRAGLLFEFDSKLYKQISRTAIGTKFVPPLACIFTAYVETEFFITLTLVLEEIYWRHFFIWTES